PLPRLAVDLGAPRESCDAVSHLRPELLVAERLLVHAEDSTVLRQPLVEEEVVERRYQLAPGEIAAGAEDHDHGGFGVRMVHIVTGAVLDLMLHPRAV